MTPSGHLVPQQLKFSTSRIQGSYDYNSMAPLTPSTPATPGNSSKMSDVESLDSNNTASVTPDFSRLKLGRSRGRLRKELIQPNMDDFPKDGTDAEKEKYICKKTTKLWQYKKLTSDSLAEYRAKENARVKEYQRSKKGNVTTKSVAEDSATSNDDDTERKKKLGRAR